MAPDSTNIVITKRLLDLFSTSDESKVCKRCYADSGDCIPAELVDELERECEEVYPYSATTECMSMNLIVGLARCFWELTVGCELQIRCTSMVNDLVIRVGRIDLQRQRRSQDPFESYESKRVCKWINKEIGISHTC